MTIEATTFFNGQESKYVTSGWETNAWKTEDGLEVNLDDFGVKETEVGRHPFMGEFKIKFGDKGQASGLVLRDQEHDGITSGSFSIGEEKVFSYEIEHKFD